MELIKFSFNLCVFGIFSEDLFIWHRFLPRYLSLSTQTELISSTRSLCFDVFDLFYSLFIHFTLDSIEMFEIGLGLGEILADIS